MVVAWRLELDGEQPEFFVLSRADGGGGGWLRLAKPRKVYERTARTVLMMVQVLHFLRRNLDGPQTALWIHLHQVFRMFWPGPSDHDFRNQTSLSLMRQFAAVDPVLANSEALRAFVERISTENMAALGAAAAEAAVSQEEDAGFQIYTVDWYYFESSRKEPVCFSTLPLRLGGAADAPEGNNNKVLNLNGFAFADRRLRVLKMVVAWRLELDGELPEFFVLPRADGGGGGGWLRLAKPRKLYERTARTVLMMAQVLHFLRRNPDGPQTALWIHLYQVFGMFWPRPSEHDFRNQTSLSLMRQFAAADPIIANSQALRAFVESISTEVGADSIDIADGEVINEKTGEDGNNESDKDLFDSICAICDDGGDILCCDGPCMRSFHAKEGSGEESYCDTLGYTEAEVEAMKLFLCKNCEYKRHQCFICGVLEPSDGATAKVFLCNNATCGHFYHPKCVAQQLHPNNINEASELEKKITEEFVFKCPIHRCFHCKGLVDRTFQPLQFAVCRRCPKSYHRKCLPRQISFEEIEGEGIITRAWELSKSFLIYCMDHEIDRDTKAPVRDHIKFPKIEEPMCKKKKRTCGPRIIETGSNFGNLLDTL